MAQYLDTIGLSYFYGKLKTKFQPKGSYLSSVPVASSSVIGGFKLGYGENGKNYAVKIDTSTNTAYVTVPWSSGSYTLPIATDSTLGGIKTGYATSGKNYAIDVDSSGKAFVNVPWTTYSVATTSTNGLMSFSDKNKLDIMSSWYEGIPEIEDYVGLISNDSTSSVVNLYVERFNLYNSSSSSETLTIPSATTSLAGVMSANDKTKLDKIIFDIQNKIDPDIIPLATAMRSGGLGSYIITGVNGAIIPKEKYALNNIANSFDISTNKIGISVLPEASASLSAGTISGTSGIMTKEDKYVTSKLYNNYILTNDADIDYGDGTMNGGLTKSKLYFKKFGISTGPVTMFVNAVMLPEVSTTKNGLMSAADKTTLDSISFISGVSSVLVNNLAFTANTNNVTLTYKYRDEATPEEISELTTSIPAATTSKAGVMSATDKTKLNNINTGIKGRIFLDLIDEVSIKKVTDGYGNVITHSITASRISNNGFILSNIPTQLRPSLSSTKLNVEVSQVNGSNWLFSEGYVEIAACGAFNTTSQLVIRLKPGSNTSQTGLCITIYNI